MPYLPIEYCKCYGCYCYYPDCREDRQNTLPCGCSFNCCYENEKSLAPGYYCNKGDSGMSNVKLIWETETLDKFGKVRIELWPEGLVIWVGGQIVFKSWEVPDDKHLFAKEWKRDFYQKNLNELKKDKQTMAREEAIAKIKEIYSPYHDGGTTIKFIDSLEALGVLKFDKPNELTGLEIIRKELASAYSDFLLYGFDIKDQKLADNIVAKLEKHGYLIVKKKHTV